MNWPFKYLGKEWIGSQDPEGRKKYDCWDHVREVQQAEFGREVEEIQPSSYDVWALIKLLKENAEIGNWKKVDRPKEGDVVQMGHAKRPHHVGTWTELDGGKIIHCLEGAGVVAQSLVALRAAGWAAPTYWTPKNED